MKKIIILMIFEIMFIACADNNVCVSPEYTQPVQDTTYTQPIQGITDTTSVTPVYYVLGGAICEYVYMNVPCQSLETMTGQCQSDTVATNSILYEWLGNCSLALITYEYSNYTLDEIKAFLTDNMLFDYNIVNTISTHLSNCGFSMYIYNTNSGLHFLYIVRIEEEENN